MKAARQLTPFQRALRDDLADGKFASVSGDRPVLAQVARFVPQGREYLLSMIQRAYRNHDPDATAWWTVWMDLQPTDQAKVDLDAVCEASGVTPDRLMGIVVSTAMRFGADVADLVAATSHPLVVRQTAKSALRIGGKYSTVAQKDREMLLQHHRFIPAPRGASVTVNANATAQAAAAAQSQPSVPTFAESLEGARSAQEALHGELIEERE